MKCRRSEVRARGRSAILLFGLFVLFLIFQITHVPNASAASITLTVPTTALSVDLDPNTNGGFAVSSTSAVSVKTDGGWGYDFSIKSKTDSNALKNETNGGLLESITTPAGGINEETFKSEAGYNNKWGFLPSKLNSVVNEKYQAGPADVPLIIDQVGAGNSDTTSYNIAIAAKVDSTVAAGTYTNTFVLTAVSNEPPVAGDMQNWDGCSELEEGEMVRLRDTRDDNIYNVAKLLDGQCWMVENLRIVDKEISSEDSDMMSGSYKVPASDISKFQTAYDNIANEAVYYGGDPDYGAHYTWQVATAGSGSNYTTDGQNAPSSICPKGWRLPTSGSDTANSDFGKLVEAYGGDNSTGSQNLRSSPANFSYAGRIYYGDGSLGYQGSYGDYWSSTASNSVYAYYLDLNDANAGPTNNYERVNGRSVRCAARGSEPELELEPLLTDLVTIDSGASEVTFKAGTGIEMIMVADENGKGTDYWSPSYGDATTDIVLPSASGKKVVITVVPESGYILDSWTKTTGSNQTWTANGKTGTYEKMKDVTASECLAAGETGMNVTDERNNVSYTIGKFDDRCWMFSNLRLEVGTTLTPDLSDVSSNFTLPSEADSNAWTSSSQNYYGKKNMKVCKGLLGYNSSDSGQSCANQTRTVTEYYYNWYSAIANPYNGGTSTTTEEQDSQSLGSVCPKNWKLFPISDSYDIDDLEVAAWNASKATNPGRLVSSGYFGSGSQYIVGSYGYWWSSSRLNDSRACGLYVARGTAGGNNYNKYFGYSVRCVR